MKKLILMLILFPSFLFSQWVKQQVPAGIDIILSIDFANTNIGAAGGWGDGYWGRAVYTTNGGTNWIPAQVPDSSRSLVKLQMIDANTGYIAGAYNIFKNDGYTNFTMQKKSGAELLNYYERIGMTGSREDYRGIFLKTTNGGKNWFTYGTLLSNVYYLTGMRFVNINTGFVTASLNYYGGISNGVLKTSNGGLSWNSLYQIDTADVLNIFTIDGNTIFAAGWKRLQNDSVRGVIIRTSNGGITWSRYFFYETGHISDVNFTNPTTGFAVSNLGNVFIDTLLSAVIYKTTNAGINWVKLGFQNPRSSYEAVEFVPGTGKGFCSGYKFTPEFTLEKMMISRTTNYGSNWTNYLINDTTKFFYCSSIADANIWFAAGGVYNGIIYKTTNGGAPIGIEPISNEIPSQFFLSQNYPNPFNPSTKIKFSLPLPRFTSGQPSKGGVVYVSLVIYDMLGKEVATLIPPFRGGQEGLRPGTYEVEWNGSSYSSGIYFYKLITSEFSETKKMVLLK